MMPQNSASDGRSIVVRRLKEKFGRNSGSLPYDSARLGLPTLYANVLQREGEPSGVASWVEAMNRGMTKSQVVLDDRQESIAGQDAVLAVGATESGAVGGDNAR